MNFAAFTDRWVAQGVKETTRLGKTDRQRILDYLLGYLAAQTRRPGVGEGWTQSGIDATADSMRRLSEAIYFTVDKGKVEVGTTSSTYSVLAALQRGTRLMDPIDKLAQTLLAVVTSDEKTNPQEAP